MLLLLRAVVVLRVRGALFLGVCTGSRAPAGGGVHAVAIRADGYEWTLQGPELHGTCEYFPFPLAVCDVAALIQYVRYTHDTQRERERGTDTERDTVTYNL